MFAAFELRCWGRLLRVHWTAKRSNQSILKEISPERSLEGLMPKLKLPILWPPDMKNWLLGKDRCWERLKAGGEGDNRGWDDWMASLTRWTWVWASSGSWWWTGKPGVLQSMGPQRVRYDWATELNWTWLYIPLSPLWCLWMIFKTPFHSNCILIICLKLSCSAEEHRLLKPSMLLLPLTSHDLGH